MFSPSPILTLHNVSKSFSTRDGRTVKALDDISLEMFPGSCLGIIGGSGSGKSTLSRIVLNLLKPDAGVVEVLGFDCAGLSPLSLRLLRKDLQVVFQEPFEALNPRMTVGRIVAEPLRLHTPLRGDAMQARVIELLGHVALGRQHVDRYPHELSGGQQQRVNIARALATHPKLIVLDEPTASLDVSVRRDLMRLLMELQAEHGLSYLLISHDLISVARMCDRVVVMRQGRVVEEGQAQAVLSEPAHDYTKLLIESDLPLTPEAVAASRARLAAGLA